MHARTSQMISIISTAVSPGLASDFASPSRGDREITDSNSKQRALRKQPPPPRPPWPHPIYILHAFHQTTRIDSELIPIVSVFFTICTPIKNLRRQLISYFLFVPLSFPFYYLLQAVALPP